MHHVKKSEIVFHLLIWCFAILYSSHSWDSLGLFNGITPKARDATRNKFFIILGFDNEGNVIGGLVINSNINYNLPATVTDYQLPVTVEQFSFLEHNSFINCSKIIVAKRSKFNKSTYRGEISDTEMMELIFNTVKESPTVNKKQLREFGII